MHAHLSPKFDRTYETNFAGNKHACMFIWHIGVHAKKPKGLSFRNDNAPSESISPHYNNKYTYVKPIGGKSVVVYLFFSHHGQCPLDHTKTPNHKQMQNAYFFFKIHVNYTFVFF